MSTLRIYDAEIEKFPRKLPVFFRRFFRAVSVNAVGRMCSQQRVTNNSRRAQALYVWALCQWCHVWAPHWSVGLWSNGLASQSVSKAVPEHRLAGWSQGRKEEVTTDSYNCNTDNCIGGYASRLGGALRGVHGVAHWLESGRHSRHLA